MLRDRSFKNAFVLEKETAIIRDCAKIIRVVKSVEGYVFFFFFFSTVGRVVIIV